MLSEPGAKPFILGDGSLVTVEICPVRGAVGVNFRLGSDYKVENHTHNYALVVNGVYCS